MMSDLFEHPLHAGANLMGQRPEILPARHPELLHRIEDRDGAPPGLVVGVHDDIAGEEQADVLLLRERLMGQARIAGAQDPILAEIQVELLLERARHVDASQDSEPFRSEGVFDAHLDVVDGSVHLLLESVAQCIAHID